MDFEKKYKDRYADSVFMPYRDGMTERLGIQDALAVLDDARNKTTKEDMRTEKVREALHFLRPKMGRPWPVDNFWQALHMEDATTRWQNVNANLNGIRRQLGVEP